MATVQFQGNPIEVETVNYSGHLFSDFYAAKSPQTGPGWYIMGRNSEKYGTLPNGKGAYVMLCARPDLKARAHPHYNAQIRRGWKTKKEATQIAEFLNSAYKSTTTLAAIRAASPCESGWKKP